MLFGHNNITDTTPTPNKAHFLHYVCGHALNIYLKFVNTRYLFLLEKMKDDAFLDFNHKI